MKLTGYTCVESAEEDFASRIKALKVAGCTEVIYEYATSTSTGLATYRRPKLMRTISGLESGDTLLVTNLGCVAWSLRQLVELLTSLRDRGIIFRTLERPIESAEAFEALESSVDTSGPDGSRVLHALRVMLSFTDALAVAADPLAPPAASTTRRFKVIELAAKLKAEQPVMTLREIGDELKRLGYNPPHGGTEWSLPSVKRLLDRARLTGILIEK